MLEECSPTRGSISEPRLVVSSKLASIRIPEASRKTKKSSRNNVGILGDLQDTSIKWGEVELHINLVEIKLKQNEVIMGKKKG